MELCELCGVKKTTRHLNSKKHKEAVDPSLKTKTVSRRKSTKKTIKSDQLESLTNRFDEFEQRIQKIESQLGKLMQDVLEINETFLKMGV